MHNEPLTSVEPEPVKPSKLQRIKSNALMAGVFVIPIALTGASMYYSGRLVKMQLETSRLNLEAAKLNHLKP